MVKKMGAISRTTWLDTASMMYGCLVFIQVPMGLYDMNMRELQACQYQTHKTVKRSCLVVGCFVYLIIILERLQFFSYYYHHARSLHYHIIIIIIIINPGHPCHDDDGKPPWALIYSPHPLSLRGVSRSKYPCVWLVVNKPQQQQMFIIMVAVVVVVVVGILLR